MEQPILPAVIICILGISVYLLNNKKRIKLKRRVELSEDIQKIYFDAYEKEKMEQNN